MANETIVNLDLQQNRTVINTVVSPNTTQLSAGTDILGKYKVIEKLNVNSGEADLYLCEYYDSKFVAKVYRREKAIKEEVLNLLKEIKSNHVAPIYDTGYLQELPVEVIPYYVNGNLQGKTFSLEELKNTIIPSLNDGLHALHSKNIFHKDLKPSNIMLTDNNKDIVIIDFGISSVRDEGNTMIITQTGLTPEYVAPEAFRNIYFDITDYYSLGITIFELFYGHNPYSNMTKAEMEQFVAIQKVPIPDDMPEELAQLVTALTYPDITNRNNKLNPNRRWGYEEVSNWCNGIKQPIPGTGNTDGVLDGDMKSYPFEGQVYTSKNRLVMALALNWESGKKQLFRGLLSAHFKNFDPEIASICMDAEELNANGKNSDIVFLNTLYKIDKQSSFLFWKGKRFINLSDFGGQILDALYNNDKEFEHYCYDVLKMKVLSHYAYSMGVKENDEKMVALKALEDSYVYNGENLEQLYLLGYMISDKMPLRVENYVFYSIDELIAEVQYLSKKNKTELVRLGKLLVPGDGTLSKSFMGWLLAHNKQDEIEKWEKSLS